MIYFDDATKQQLLQIALHEPCSLDDKYQAARELQLRQWNDAYLTDLVRLWGNGMSIFNIAIELGTEPGTINHKLEQYGLFKTRVGA